MDLGACSTFPKYKRETGGSELGELCVEWGGAPTVAGTSVFIMWKFLHTWSVMLNTMGILEWGIYGRGSYGKVSCCFVGIYSKKKSLVFREVYSFWSSHDYGFQKTSLQRSTLSDHHITMGRGGEGGKGGGTSSMLLHWCYHQHLHQGWHLDRSCGYYSRLSLLFNTGLATSYSTNSAQSYTFCTLCS